MDTYKTRQEFAVTLGVSTRTLYRIIKRLDVNIPERSLLSPKDQRTIILAVYGSRESP